MFKKYLWQKNIIFVKVKQKIYDMTVNKNTDDVYMMVLLLLKSKLEMEEFVIMCDIDG